MKDYIWILAIIGIFVLWVIISWVRETISNSKKYLELKPKLDNLESAVKAHELKVEKDEAEFETNSKKRLDEFSQIVKRDKDAINKLAQQKSMGFPWLADAYADYFLLQDMKRQKYLENKIHPAGKTAEIVREIKNEKKILLAQNKVISYKLAYLVKLFPWLSELIAEDENEEIPVRIDDVLQMTIARTGLKTILLRKNIKAFLP